MEDGAINTVKSYNEIKQHENPKPATHPAV